MRLFGRGVRRSTAVVAGAAVLALTFPADAHGPGVFVSKVSGGRTVSASGTAHVPHGPLLAVDAGDSRFAEAGQPLTLTPIVSGATGPVEHRWTGPGKLTVAPNGSVTVDTKGVAAGTHTYTLEALDKASGTTARDSVKAVLVSPTTFVSASKATTVGLPDEDLGNGGAVDGQTTRYAFTVPPRTQRVDMTLDWGVAVNDYDLRVDDPSNVNDADTTGASLNKPERVTYGAPAAGSWFAIVNAYLTVPDTFRVSVTGLVAPNLPKVTTTGPYTVVAGSPVTLKASPTGGRGPHATAWDLDMDGVFETAGTEVTSRFALGSQLVAVKTTDADGFEAREVTAVKVTAPGAGGAVPGLVVVAINDTGVNPYHDEWSAKTFPDERILKLTDNFTRHPSDYIPGYPKDAPALRITQGKGYLPKEDEALWTQANIPLQRLNWIPGTKIVGAIDAGNGGAVNAAADVRPIIDEDGHGTASASVAVGNATGYCPSCLLVAIESLSATNAYRYDWVDIVSTSGSNTLGAPIFTPLVGKDVVERGQTVLFAAGNGNEGAFLTPNDTYRSNWSGPDWVIRVGAANSRSKKPILGDGNPVDVSSFGDGPIPAAEIATTSALTNHSGTSAASPITAGVIGSILSGVREQLGQTSTGQKAGVVATGRKLPSPYLNDGVLTRAELWEIALKTAEPSTTSDVRLLFPQVPFTPAHYVFQGYGIADFDSAQRGLDVAIGRRPLPARTAEDQFLAADSDMRVRLFGSWKGAKPAKAPAAGKPASTGADAPRIPFEGVGFDDVGTLDKSLPLLQPHVPNAFRTSAARGGAAGSAAAAGGPAFTSPSAGALVDTSVVSKLAVTGTAAGAALTRTPGGARKFFLRRAGCGAATGDNVRMSQQDGPDPGSGCGLALQAMAPVGIDFEEVYAAADGVPLAIDPARPIKGTIFVDGSGVSPMHTITIGLYDGPRLVGQQTVTKSVVNVRRVVSGQNVKVNNPVPFDFSFNVLAVAAGRDLKSLALKISIDRSGGVFFHSLDDPASFVEVPILGPPAAGSVVEVSVDDPTFKTPARADVQPDGSWGTNVELAPLAAGKHLLRARVLSGGKASPVSELPFTITRAGKAIVQIQATPRGQQPAADRWVDARDTSKAKDFSAWSGSISRLSRGQYDLHARIVARGAEVSRSAPKAFTRR